MNDRQGLQIVVYSRAGCCLCHAAEQMLRDRQSLGDFDIRVVDIDADPGLRERYDTCIPVITFDGTERFRGAVSAALLDRQLRAQLGLRR